MKYEYTHSFKLSITKEEIEKTHKITVSDDVFEKAVRDELYQCACGITEGDFGGNYLDDWTLVLKEQLVKQGILNPTNKQ
jgi:hypothetical protein